MSKISVTAAFCLLLAIAFAGIGCPAAHRSSGETARIATGDFDPATFKTLNEGEKLNFIVEKLDTRDRLLENFSCKVREGITDFRVSDGGGRHFMTRQDWEFRRLGVQYWLKRIDYEFYGTDLNVRQAIITNWDGKAGRTTGAPEGPHDGQSCIIRPVQSTQVALNKYLELMGFRMYVDMNRTTCAIEFMRDASKPDRELRITDEQLGGMHMIRISVTKGDEHWSLWLDPSRGYLTARLEHRFVHGARNIGTTADVRAAEQVDGVWVPRKVLCVSGGLPCPRQASQLTRPMTSGSAVWASRTCGSTSPRAPRSSTSCGTSTISRPPTARTASCRSPIRIACCTSRRVAPSSIASMTTRPSSIRLSRDR